MTCRARRIAALVVGTLVAGIWAGCSLENPSAPSLTAPSEFGTSVTLTASPDRLPRDGSSQSVITLTVRDAQNRPVSGQRLTVGVSPSAARLSATEVVTDASGLATVAVTAPAASDLAGSTVTIEATPVGSSGASAVPRFVTVSLTGAANLRAPSPSFTVTPTSPEINQVTTFDASASTDEPAPPSSPPLPPPPCLDACRYSWNFGDGSPNGAGRIEKHAFSSAGTYTVTLTVTDPAGASASAFLPIRVVTVPAPTDITLSVVPESPFKDQQAVFTAVAKPAPGHSIQRYEWNFGDGATEVTPGPSVAHKYSEIGTYVATVTVTDDLGQTGIGAKTVIVDFKESKPVAILTVSPKAPGIDASVTFDGSGSTVGFPATITEYTWNFGDGTAEKTTVSSTTRPSGYPKGEYSATLTVKDSLGRTATSAPVSIKVE